MKPDLRAVIWSELTVAPSGHSSAARPSASVVAVEFLNRPPLIRRLQATEAPPTGLPVAAATVWISRRWFFVPGVGGAGAGLVPEGGSASVTAKPPIRMRRATPQS